MKTKHLTNQMIVSHNVYIMRCLNINNVGQKNNSKPYIAQGGYSLYFVLNFANHCQTFILLMIVGYVPR